MEIQNIEIVLAAPYYGDRCDFELKSSAPVTTDITVTQWIHYIEENVCEGRVDYETDMLIEVTIPKGESYAVYSVSTGNDSCTLTSIYAEKDNKPIMKWEGQTINNGKYTSTGGWF
ncbi:hypothetical protein [Bacteroides sp. 2201st1_D9_2201SCRN_220225]|uniref:hypothetical protein n=1 Tax=Bacteroides sp. 2201st1_D9_2201SCRN_220225 TaxID=3143218 RepID=UPI0034A329C0